MKCVSRLAVRGLGALSGFLLFFSPWSHVFGEEINFPALVRAISAVESAGNPRAVGAAGERGLMQIKATTWHEVTRRTYGEHIPFHRAFEPDLNQQVGLAYLEELAARLGSNRHKLNDSFLAVLVASYHCGPGLLETVGYSTQRLAPEVRDYVERVLNLHWLYADGQRLAALEGDSLTATPPQQGANTAN